MWGWSVNRLIRVSFGPFQLGDLETGAVEEIKPRIVAQQLGDEAAQALGMLSSSKPPARSAAPVAGPKFGGPKRGGKPKASPGAGLKANVKPNVKPGRERGAEGAGRRKKP